MKLSILIPTLEERREQLDELYSVIEDQCRRVEHFLFNDNVYVHRFPAVEIIWCRDAGERSVGAKRQLLLDMATGDYIAFIDDDDNIPDDYIAKVLNAIEPKPSCKNCEYAFGNCQKSQSDGLAGNEEGGDGPACEYYNAKLPDCCSLTGEIHFKNGVTRTFKHSIDYDEWEMVGGVYLRYPNHLNTVKRELALQVGFKDMGHGEDKDYSDRLKPLLKTEAKIEGVIYHYNCRMDG